MADRLPAPEDVAAAPLAPELDVAVVLEEPPVRGKFEALPDGFEPPGPFSVPGPLLGRTETVMLPLGMEIDEPEFSPETTAPIVGNGALGSTVHALVPAVEAGQAGGDVVTVLA